MSTYVVLMVDGEPTAINMNKVDKVVHSTRGGKDNLDFYFDKTYKIIVEDLTIEQLVHDVIQHEL
jgi:hypothetical protein